MGRTFTPSDLQEIESLINSITVACEMCGRFRESGDVEKGNMWFHHQAERTCQLADQFGICVPGLEHCRRQMELMAERRRTPA